MNDEYSIETYFQNIQILKILATGFNNNKRF